eukprot:SAG31_NODE_2666_length_5273_cov_2.404716_2_plen_99_part_00
MPFGELSRAQLDDMLWCGGLYVSACRYRNHLGSKQLTRYLLQFIGVVVVVYIFSGFAYGQYRRVRDWLGQSPEVCSYFSRFGSAIGAALKLSGACADC